MQSKHDGPRPRPRPRQVAKPINAAVEILAPTSSAKVKRSLEGIANTRVVEKPSGAKRARILVGWVSDLGLQDRRRALEKLVDSAEAGSPVLPFVLVEAKAKSPLTYLALEKLTRWGCLGGFYLAPDLNALRRMVEARLAGAEDQLMASASVDDGELVVWSCEPKRYVVALSEVPALASLTEKDSARFCLSPSGSRLHWRPSDIDLDLASVRFYADPKTRQAQTRARREEASRYTGAIRAFRRERGLTQSSIPGLTDRQVRRIEQGENIPQIETLTKLAAAHGLELDQYLKELAQRSSQTESEATLSKLGL